jgi:two-component system sensor histidine kinase KdpD
MSQVLGNLIENAAKYSPAEAPIAVSAERRGERLELRVADCGPGIAPADRERVFERFYRAPGVRAPGTGLGLAISRGLIEAHGGTIAVEERSRLAGSVFVIRLPLPRRPAAPALSLAGERG